MATVSVQVDDLTGEQATDISTVQFGFLGEDYEIDLTEANLDDFVEVMKRYVDAGRVRTASRGARPKASGRDNAAIRAWCAENGIEVASSGMIPRHAIEAYEAAQRQDEAPAGEGDEKARALHWWNVTMSRKEKSLDEVSPMIVGQYKKWLTEQQEQAAEA